MDGIRSRAAMVAGFLILVAMSASTAWAQAPQVDVDNPPGVPDGRGRLGPALGASGTSKFEGNSVNPSTLGGRPGASSGRAPIGEISPSNKPMLTQSPLRKPTETADSKPQIPAITDLDFPIGEADPGPADGLTLDGAIDLLLRNNLNLIALRYEIPMAQADVLTASLRANPIFYADSQLIPYGRYSNARPGGQTQYDVNITFPLDVWQKRKARTEVACKARKVTEAQFQDAARQQIDNLYTAYVDVVAASETLRFSQAYVKGIARLLQLNRDLLQRGQVVAAARRWRQVWSDHRLKGEAPRVVSRLARDALAGRFSEASATATSPAPRLPAPARTQPLATS